MDSKSFLMKAAEVQATEAAPRLDFRDVQRSIVLLSSFRSGSHMLKLSLNKLTGLIGKAEPFNHLVDDPNGYTLKDYLAEGGPQPRLMTEGHMAVHHFLARFYQRLPPRTAVLFDVKYPQAYAFGVNAQMDLPLPVPTLLEEFHRLDMPFIHLVRRDLVAQAISLMIAEDTGTFFLQPGSLPATNRMPEVTLSPRTVLARALRLRNARDHAREVLTALGSKVLEVSYESLISTDGRGHYREIMRFIGQYADIPADFEPPTLRQNSQSRVSNMADVRDFVAKRDPALNG